jgi:pimeloyl-ACP methyl ester carboxylesterase
MAFTEDFFVKNQAQDISVVGHSWGGFLALNLLSHYPKICKHLILLSPLLEIPTEDQISRLAPQLFSKHRGILVAQTEESLVSDFKLTRESYSPLNLLSEAVQEKITIVQAFHDDEIPAD